jgi:hypothetical protein
VFLEDITVEAWKKAFRELYDVLTEKLNLTDNSTLIGKLFSNSVIDQKSMDILGVPGLTNMQRVQKLLVMARFWKALQYCTFMDELEKSQEDLAKTIWEKIRKFLNS